MMMKTGNAVLVAMTTAVLLLTAGCDEEGKSGQVPASPATTNQQAKTPAAPGTQNVTPSQTEIKLYFPNEAGDGLQPVKVNIPSEDKYTQAVKELVAGTKEPGLINIFPKGVKVRSVKVTGNLATVDFSKELTHKFVGGSTGEQMLVSALVNTMTEFPEIEQVLITVEGERIETIAGHLDTSEPFTRPTGLVQ